MQRRTIGAWVAGVLCANSLPHLATAASGRRLLTPLAGRTSGRWANLAWGGINLAAGLTLIANTSDAPETWTERLMAFGAGAASFSAWAVIGEKLFRFNS